MKILMFTKSTGTNKIHGIISPVETPVPLVLSLVPGDMGEIIVGSYLKL
jgi:hypothetical protein